MDPAKDYGRRYNPAPDPSVKLSLHVPDSMVRAMDTARGPVTRMEWIRTAIRERLDRLDKASK
jgi:hypothetical protein